MKNMTLCVSVAALLALTAACTPTVSKRGNMVEDYRLATVVTGTDTQSDVLRKLGSPTTKSPFDDSIWYYMGQETEKRGILDPEVVKEKIVVVTFDETGIVTFAGQPGASRQDIPYVRGKTTTSGQEMTVIEQFVGNLGRFNKEAGPRN